MLLMIKRLTCLCAAILASTTVHAESLTSSIIQQHIPKIIQQAAQMQWDQDMKTHTSKQAREQLAKLFKPIQPSSIVSGKIIKLMNDESQNTIVLNIEWSNTSPNNIVYQQGNLSLGLESSANTWIINSAELNQISTVSTRHPVSYRKRNCQP